MCCPHVVSILKQSLERALKSSTFTYVQCMRFPCCVIPVIYNSNCGLDKLGEASCLAVMIKGRKK